MKTETNKGERKHIKWKGKKWLNVRRKEIVSKRLHFNKQKPKF